MVMPNFNKGDLIERDKTVAEVTGPVTEHGAVTVLIEGKGWNCKWRRAHDWMV